MKGLFTWISICAGFAAAALWWWASMLKVKPKPAEEVGAGGWRSASIIETSPSGPHVDILATIKKQSQVNAWGASCAAVAAASQAIALMLPDGA